MFKFLKNDAGQTGSKALNFSYTTFSIVVFFLSIVFLPLSGYSSEVFKSFFFVFGVMIAFITWFIGGVINGGLLYSKNNVMRYFGLFLLIALVSSLVSTFSQSSLFGTNFEIGTFFTLLSAGAAMVLAAVHFYSVRSFYSFANTLSVSALAIALLQILRFFLPEFFSFGILNSINQSLIGNLHSTTIFFALAAVLSLGMIEFIPLQKKQKKLSLVTLIVSLIFVALAGYKDVWIVTGMISLVFFVGSLQESQKSNSTEGSKDAKIPVHSLSIMFVSILFILLGSIITSAISPRLGYIETEVRPSVTATGGIYISSVKEDPFFGVGPNNFSKVWPLYKPLDVNETVFWDTNFNYGAGYLPTFAINTGVVGTIPLLIFVVALIFMIVKRGFMGKSESKDPLTRYVLSSLAAFALYYLLFYVSSVALFYLSFVIFGMFIGRVSPAKYSFLPKYINKNNMTLGIVGAVFVVIAGLVLTTFYIRSFVATLYFRSAVMAFNIDNDLPKTEAQLASAAGIFSSDQYYRGLVDVYIRRMSDLASGNAGDLSQDQTLAAFQSALSLAENAARNSIATDTSNYINWITLGRVYESVVPFGVANAYDSAKTAYNEALILNPNSPAMMLIMARLEVVNKDYETARENVKKAIALKSNYAQAYFLLSRIEFTESNTTLGERYLSQAATLDTSDYSIQYAYGAYLYEQGTYGAAVTALERAVMANVRSVEARYSLALAYEKSGSKENAILQLRIADQLAPDNDTIKSTISRIEKGIPAQVEPVVEETEEETVVQ